MTMNEVLAVYQRARRRARRRSTLRLRWQHARAAGRAARRPPGDAERARLAAIGRELAARGRPVPLG